MRNLNRLAVLVLACALLAFAMVAYAALRLRPSAEAMPQATAMPSTSALRTVKTPGVVVDDMKLTPGHCHAVVVDAASGVVKPDPNCTPGAIDPRVTQDNLASTICKSGYTAGKDVRPPSSATNKTKASALSAYGMKDDGTVEYDHLVSLQLGGASTTSNLWPEPNKAGAKARTNPKDATETKLNAAVCNGLVPLASAQQAIADDWTTALKRLGIVERNSKLCTSTKCVPASRVGDDD